MPICGKSFTKGKANERPIGPFSYNTCFQLHDFHDFSGLVVNSSLDYGEAVKREHFRALLDLIMCSDPSPMDARTDQLVRDWANEESKRWGFADWIDAYHNHKID